MLQTKQAVRVAGRTPVARRFILSMCTGLLLMLSLWLMVSADSTPLSVAGYLDFSYQGWDGPGSPSGEKQESKLWWNDGFWWASMFNSSTSKFHIYRLNWGTHTWEDWGIELDDRIDSKADVLWDDTAKKLYVATHVAVQSDGEIVASIENWARLYRFSYDAEAQTYILDDGFPVNMNQDKSESLVLAKDSTGRLWITWVSRGLTPKANPDYRVFLNTSDDDGASWGTPIVPTLNITGTAVHVNRGDSSSIVAVADKVALMWNNSISNTNQTLHFALHDAGTGASNWLHRQVAVPEGADDHISVKSLQATPGGKVFAGIKTDAVTSDPFAPVQTLIAMFGIDITTGDTIMRRYSTNFDKDTRPMVMIDVGDTANTGDDKVYVFVSGKEGGSKICYKALDIKSPITDMGQFSTKDCGTSFIEDLTYDSFNDATSMKTPASKVTGLVVLATDGVSETAPITGAVRGPQLMYGHGEMGNPPPVVTSRYPAPSATNVALTAVVTATFSKPMESSTFNATNFVVEDESNTQVFGTYDYDAGSRTIFFTPDAPLQALMTYTVKLTNGIKDDTGQGLNEGFETGPDIEVWRFGTEPPLVRFTESVYSINEVDGSVLVTAALNSALAISTTVQVDTSDNTASAGSGDYTATSTTLTFNPGEMVKSVAIPILDDATLEGNESFTVTLSAPTNVVLGEPSAASVIIIDDEATSVQFNPSSVTVNEDVGQATLNVVLSKAAPFAITVDYASSNGTAVAGSDYTAVNGTLTFTPGVTSRTVTVPITDDAANEVAETINLALSNVSPVSVTISSLGGTAVVTVNDNDTTPIVKFSTNAYTVAENGGTAEISVVLSSSSALPVTVQYATANGVALAGSDYTAASGTVTFAAGETSKSFTVAITNDALDETNEVLNLKLSAPQNATLGTPNTAQLTIQDDDPAPTVQFGAATFTESENGSVAVIEVTLSGPSGQLVSVDYAASNGTATENSDYASTSGTLLFSPGETSQTFEVPVLDDTVGEPTETIQLALSAPSGATLGSQATATLEIQDNDAEMSAVGFSSANYSVSEGDGSASITVELAAASSFAVSVQYSISAGTAVAGSDFVAATGTLNFAVGETSKTFDVAILDDPEVEGNETVLLTLTGPNNAVLGAQDSATLTINDNDTSGGSGGETYLPLILKQ
ncbi:MAG: Calx-beta domain-containing protein [Caldilineaceae bacterium]